MNRAELTSYLFGDDFKHSRDKCVCLFAFVKISCEIGAIGFEVTFDDSTSTNAMIRRQVQQRKRLVCELKAVERELKAVEVCV